MKIILKLSLIVIFLVISCSNAFASMQSTNYKIGSDVFGEVGGTSSSTNYKMTANVGESVTGVSSSTNYKAHQGYLTTEIPVLNFAISNNTITFGTLTSIDVKTGETTLTISTNALGGYNVRAYDNTPAGISNGLISGTKKIADATTPNVYITLPSSGTEHFGIVATGTHAASGYASGTKINSLDDTTYTDIGSYADFISDDTLTVQYRASISSATPASNTFQSTTTYIASGNF